MTITALSLATIASHQSRARSGGVDSRSVIARAIAPEPSMARNCSGRTPPGPTPGENSVK